MNLRDLTEVFFMYLVTAFVGVWVAEQVTGSLILKAGLADIAMTLVIFSFSLWKSNSSTYDAYWSVIPFYLVLWLLLMTDNSQWHWQQWLTMLVVTLWSWRLTINWARSWPGWQHEDWRYIDFRREHGKYFQLTNFFAIHIIPTGMVFLACIGLFTVATSSAFTDWLMLVGIATGLAGIALEFIADNQLYRFRQRSDPQPRDMLDTGLWGVIRFPNYLGEMLFWWGVALCGLSAGAETWTLAGAIAMMLLFAFGSIPMKDKRMSQGRPGYIEYCARVPALLPSRLYRFEEPL